MRLAGAGDGCPGECAHAGGVANFHVCEVSSGFVNRKLHESTGYACWEVLADGRTQ